MSGIDGGATTTGDAAPPEVDRALLELLVAAEALSRELRIFLDHALSPFEISTGEYEVLARLRAAGPPHRSSPGELATALGRSSGGMTKRLVKLESRGLLHRARDPEDGRGAVVSLTPAGLEVEQRVIRTIVVALGARLREGGDAIEPAPTARSLIELARTLGA